MTLLSFGLIMLVWTYGTTHDQPLARSRDDVYFRVGSEHMGDLPLQPSRDDVYFRVGSEHMGDLSTGGDSGGVEIGGSENEENENEKTTHLLSDSHNSSEKSILSTHLLMSSENPYNLHAYESSNEMVHSGSLHGSHESREQHRALGSASRGRLYRSTSHLFSSLTSKVSSEDLAVTFGKHTYNTGF